MSKLLTKWGYFGYQKSEIRTALGVFGALSGGEVIIVLENDEVLAFGGNHKGCLGVGNEREVKALKRIESLCGQEIQGFECSVYTGNEGDEICLFAISGSGSVFSWGHNEDGQLGLGTTIYTKVPTKISSSLEQKRVVQVACSGDHTLALTSEGEVYAFGVNGLGQLGLGSTVHHFLLPQRVGGLLDGKIVTSVACQNIASFALLQSGEIFAWGANTSDRLGLSPSSDKCSPSKVIGLEGVVISKIVCGASFILALSDDGKIYSWGENHRGQLGNGTATMAKRPTIVISTQMGKVREFAATHYFRHPCAAITEEDKVFIWGSWKDKTFMAPIPTSFSSFDDVFADASPPMTYQRFELKEFIITKVQSKKKDSVIELLQKAFDKPETADVAFIVKGEKIHVHKNLLTIGSEVFKNLFLGDRKESCKNEQIIEDHSYDAFYAFLKFFYTDQVDFKPELALEVYSLAHFYQVTGLMEKCEKILKSGLTVQNAAAVYEKAILFGAEDLCEFCFEFCKKHLVYVVNSFESAETKREVILEVFRRAAKEKKK